MKLTSGIAKDVDKNVEGPANLFSQHSERTYETMNANTKYSKGGYSIFPATVLSLLLIVSGCEAMKGTVVEEVIFGPSRDARGRKTLYFVKTDDDWTLAISRRYPKTGRSLYPPVILCHGFTYNSRVWSIAPEANLSTYLADRGYDVWMPNLRGAGDSTKWVSKLLELRRKQRSQEGKPIEIQEAGVRNLTLDPKYADWTVDDYVVHDVPAIIAAVCRETGSDRVMWVGHSMGGIAILGHLIRTQDQRIARVVTVGSQVTMDNPETMIKGLSELLEIRRRQLLGADESSVEVTHRLFYNLDNMRPETVPTLETIATDPPSAGVIKQLLDMAKTGVLRSANGDYDYAVNIRKVATPAMFVTGARDVAAPPAVQETMYRAIGSQEKKLIICGRANGFSADAGHIDALLGTHAADELFPSLERFLSLERETVR